MRHPRASLPLALSAAPFARELAPDLLAPWEQRKGNRSINRRRPGGNEDLEAPVGVHLHASQSCDFRLVVEIMVSKSKAKSKLSDFINRYDKVNYPHGIDEEKSHEFYPRKFSLAEHGEVGGNCVANDNTHPKLIPLDGCSASEAVTFLTERWAAAVHLLDNSSADVSEFALLMLFLFGTELSFL
ncbi:hypothetical protein MUK42_05743 [Musa troglodytarum]|uniref:Uncharacterized protein n=1 Tax=Musa troglodytarum TaxID=320322 RepID=A0A9E7HAV0_9LILI|nr:hypothetical protein MUK42_05743 [Musa troglodytarum]